MTVCACGVNDTRRANDFCKGSKRQTVSASDVFDALKEIDLEDFVEPLKRCLEAQRLESQARKKAKTSDVKVASEEKVEEEKGDKLEMKDEETFTSADS